MKLVADLDQNPVLGGPAGIAAAAVHERRQHRRVQPGLFREERRVHAPFVLRAAKRRDPVDDDFALPERQVALIEQRAAPEALEQPWIARQSREQRQRGDPGRHDALEHSLDFRGIGRSRRLDPC